MHNAVDVLVIDDLISLEPYLIQPHYGIFLVPTMLKKAGWLDSLALPEFRGQLLHAVFIARAHHQQVSARVQAQLGIERAHREPHLLKLAGDAAGLLLAAICNHPEMLATHFDPFLLRSWRGDTRQQNDDQNHENEPEYGSVSPNCSR